MLLLLAVGLRPAHAQVKGPAPRHFQQDAGAERAAAASRIAPQLQRYRALTLDLTGLRAALAPAPLRGAAAAPVMLSLPLPDGSTGRFNVWEAPLLAPALAAQYPDLHTYGGQGVDDPSARLSLTISPDGFQVQVLSEQAQGAAYVEAASQGDTQHYISYYAKDVQLSAGTPAGCGTQPSMTIFQPTPRSQRQASPGAPSTSNLNSAVGPTLTVYRLIVTTTKEYTNARTSSAVMTDVVAMVNNVRTIQERDLAVTLTLVGTHFYQVGADGGYDQSSDSQMVNQNRTNVETEFGASAFDLGHLFSTAGTGQAYVGVVGTTANGGTAYTYKAGAVSGNLNRTSPASYYSTSVIAHEMGHQLSAGHTFNNTQGSCSGARTSASAWEPGKGSTIMAYTDGSCDSPNNNTIQSSSDDYYHTGSIEQIRTYIESIPSIGTQVSSGNNVPVLSVPIDRTIPQGTPFKLTATGTDADAGDVLKYTWEEIDLGSAANLNTAQATADNVPLFRSVAPSTTGSTRYFPSLSNYSGSASTSTAERLPSVARSLTLRCTVRDYHAVSGTAATNTASSIVGGVTLSRNLTLTVSAANASPFAVTAPNTAVTWAAGTTQAVTWTGAGTKTSAVNCQTVNVRLSTDGGSTYPVVLAAGVANVDGAGSVNVTVPNVATTTARIMVEAADNYFFDISDVNFTITNNGALPAITSLSPTSGPASSTLTINGSNFGTSAAALSVTVGGVAAVISGTVTNTSFNVTVPATALTGNVVVTKSGAGTASGGVFQVTPVIASVTPPAGPVGTSIVISGASFGGATRVSFNGFETTSFTLNTAANPNTISLTVPAGATTGTLLVYTAGGASNSSITYTVESFALSSVAPAFNSRAAMEYSNVAATFSAALKSTNATLAPLKVSSLQAGGRKAGASSVSGSTLTFDPTTNFHAGETVQFTLANTALSNAGATLAQSYVGQYTVRTRSMSGLASATSYTAGAQPYASVAGDLNGDNKLDLVVANYNSGSTSSLTVMLNNGAGAFPTVSTISTGIDNGAKYLLLGDLNNDSKMDLLVITAGGGASSKIDVLKGNGDGTFAAQTTLTVGPPGAPALGDLNGDGNLDLVVPEAYGNVGYIVTAIGDGNFGFAISRYTGVSLGAVGVALGDLNGDGKLDLAAATYNGNAVSVRRGTGTGSFLPSTDASSQELSAAGLSSVVLADLTNDGYLDLAASQPYTSGTPISVWTGTASGTLNTTATALSTGGGQAMNLVAADYNGDGTLELLAPLANASPGIIQTFRYSGSAFSSSTQLVVSAGSGPQSATFADLNDDGALDLVLPNSTGSSVQVAMANATGAPLPVELVAFAAARRGPGAVALTWRTAQELHNRGFVVERSLDGQHFGAIASEIPGLGTSSAGRSYEYADGTAPASQLYYRLRQTDYDGAVSYSPVAAVAAVTEAAALRVYPNPAHKTAYVQLAESPAATQVLLLDAMGRAVRQVPVPAAGAVLELPLEGLPAGVYLVRCGALNQRLIVE